MEPKVEAALQNSVMGSLKWGSLGPSSCSYQKKKVNACGAGKTPPRKNVSKLEEVLKRVNAMVREDSLPHGSDSKASAYNAGDLGSVHGLGPSPGEGNSNPLQYSCLENPMDGGAW